MPAEKQNRKAAIGLNMTAMKASMVCSLAMFFFIALMAIEGDKPMRMLLVVPVVVLYLATLVLYGIGYDNMRHGLRQEKGRKRKNNP